MLYVDVETTGLEQSDRICSIAVLSEHGGGFALEYELVNEGKKIPPLASSVHNITNEMIQGKPPLKELEFAVKIEQAKTEVFVAHNAPFELMMLGNSGVVYCGDVIDTLRVSKHLMSDLQSYALNFLRYELKLYKKEKSMLEALGLKESVVPHHAPSDVVVTKLLFDELLKLATVDTMVALTKKPVLLEKFIFGKYTGRYIEEISMIDRGYLEWMLRGIENLDEDLRYSLEYYL